MKNYDEMIDDMKLAVLENKNKLDKPYWNEFILWLIEEVDFDVEENFNLDIPDEYGYCPDCEDCCGEAHFCKDRT